MAPRVTAAWSPSAAREAAKADHCALRDSQGRENLPAQVKILWALRVDTAFDSPTAAQRLLDGIGPAWAPRLAALVEDSRR